MTVGNTSSSQPSPPTTSSSGSPNVPTTSTNVPNTQKPQRDVEQHSTPSETQTLQCLDWGECTACTEQEVGTDDSCKETSFHVQQLCIRGDNETISHEQIEAVQKKNPADVSSRFVSCNNGNSSLNGMKQAGNGLFGLFLLHLGLFLIGYVMVKKRKETNMRQQYSILRL